MDKLLPRGAPRSLMTFSAFLARSPSSSSSSSSISFACFTLSRARSLSTSTGHHLYCSYSNKDKSAMEIYIKDNEGTIKDLEREGFCKGACDYPADHDILPHILNLYGSRGTPQDFDIYASDATFEDPLMCAHGIKQIKSAFYSLGKIFSESRIVDYSIKENIISPAKKEMLIDNKQRYKFMGKDIQVISLIKLYIEDGKIVRHEDWWDKKPLWNRDTVKVPLVGRMIEVLRRGSMFTTHALMGCGKDPKMQTIPK